MKPQKTRSGRHSIKQKKGYRNDSRTERLLDNFERQQRIDKQKKDNEKGDWSEKKATAALDNLAKKLGRWIIFQHAPVEKNSPKDHRGVDHIIIMISPEHEKIEFQVKSSDKGARIHQKRYPHIPVVVIRVTKGEVNTGVLVNIDEAEKEIMDKLFREYFIRNHGEASYKEFLKENY